MPTILETLNARNRARQSSAPPGSSQGVIAALVLRTDGPRFILSDGTNSFAADSVVSQRFKQGDRVWVAVGRGTSIILGLAGRDVAFAEGE